jgi:uncharacterized protein (TIGR00725 family)
VRKYQIGVIGYNDDRCTREAQRLAYEVGREVALSGSVLVCGGLGGVMEAACRGAKEMNGVTVGIIPQDNFSFANQYCDIVVCSGIGFARDFIVATSCDGIISVGGGVGTLIEMSVAYMIRKRVVSISKSGGISDAYGGKYLDERNRVLIYSAPDAKTAVQILLKEKEKEKEKEGE